MPTNDERREVAARLRVINDTEWTHPREELRALDEALGTAQGMPHALQTTWERLADLIEPEERTCEMELCDTGEWFTPECREEYLMCSRCKFVGYYVQVSEDADYWCEKPRYCPNCGSRVIE